jgi:CBS domain-containing protein
MVNLTARDIMSSPALTVGPDLSVKEFAQFLLQHKISGAPVLDETGKLVGIATEGDLIFRDAAVHLPTVVTLFDAVIYLESPKKFEQEMHKIIGGKVRDLMSTDVITVKPDATLSEMATIMNDRHRHLLPVVENGMVVGVIGKADLVRGIAQEE